MPALVIPDTVEVRLIWQLDGVDWAVNVLHYLNPGVGVDAVLAQAIADDINTKSGTSYGGNSFRGLLTDNVRLARVGVRNIDVPNQPEVFNATQPVFAGGSTSDPIPVNVALVATLRTALAGRSYRGRIYWGGWGEGVNTSGGNPLAGLVTAVQGFTNSLRDITLTTGVHLLLGVASRKLGELNQVTSVSVDGNWDTQRRRSRSGI